MRFKSEADRLAHPLAKHIPINVWCRVFEEDLSDTSLDFFSKPPDVLLK